MVEDATADLAKRRPGPLPSHVLERVLFERQPMRGFGRCEQKGSSEPDHVVFPRPEWPGECRKRELMGMSNCQRLKRHDPSSAPR